MTADGRPDADGADFHRVLRSGPLSGDGAPAGCWWVDEVRSGTTSTAVPRTLARDLMTGTGTCLPTGADATGILDALTWHGGDVSERDLFGRGLREALAVTGGADTQEDPRMWALLDTLSPDAAHLRAFLRTLDPVALSLMRRHALRDPSGDGCDARPRGERSGGSVAGRMGRVWALLDRSYGLGAPLAAAFLAHPGLEMTLLEAASRPDVDVAAFARDLSEGRVADHLARTATARLDVPRHLGLALPAVAEALGRDPDRATRIRGDILPMADRHEAHAASDLAVSVAKGLERLPRDAVPRDVDAWDALLSCHGIFPQMEFHVLRGTTMPLPYLNLRQGWASLHRRLEAARGDVPLGEAQFVSTDLGAAYVDEVLHPAEAIARGLGLGDAVPRYRGRSNAPPPSMAVGAVARYLAVLDTSTLDWNLLPGREVALTGASANAGYDVTRPGAVERVLDAWRPHLPRRLRSSSADELLREGLKVWEAEPVRARLPRPVRHPDQGPLTPG